MHRNGPRYRFKKLSTKTKALICGGVIAFGFFLFLFLKPNLKSFIFYL